MHIADVCERTVTLHPRCPQLIPRRWSSQLGRKGEDAEEGPALHLPRSLSQDFSAVAAVPPPAKHATHGTVAAAWGEANRHAVTEPDAEPAIERMPATHLADERH